ncbi:C-type lectin [Elysia marginata]|uniref:C-type lectin n=1 Tax=Elysia marginata TaxID=1093978 RepID=A0AAV4EHW1_9GAST|nr:C-type lectin [Elysia marginata]
MMSRAQDWAWVQQDCFTSQGMVSVCERLPTHLECFQDSCYQLFYARFYDWQTEDKCNATGGGHVLEINSAEERDFVKGFLNTAPPRRKRLGEFPLTSVWLGATDSAVEGEFRWLSDNSEIDFQDWARGQPANIASNRMSQDCVALDLFQDWRWDDVSCHNTNALVCEIKNVNGSSG